MKRILMLGGILAAVVLFVYGAQGISTVNQARADDFGEFEFGEGRIIRPYGYRSYSFGVAPRVYGSYYRGYYGTPGYYGYGYPGYGYGYGAYPGYGYGGYGYGGYGYGGYGYGYPGYGYGYARPGFGLYLDF